ncbi:MAG: YhdH/YhfP family quinone oxidoreductase [Deltaproteobacteria bacterium]|nr:YhdH/YhfP family quinone oxidoreductase [Deltaproteobacteria bacterium]MBW2181760.1 YhdH/YhfP family quinone oxidoreductase [Deltaproteobacteria bacterium]
MEDRSFKAMVVTETSEKTFTKEIKDKAIGELPAGEVTIKVSYSSLNYKDALSATGNKGVTRNYPHTPGIDAAGIVEESTVNDFKSGEEVIVTSYDLGMNTSGGFGEYIRVPANWVVKRPENLSLKESMIYGTAGFTAGLSVNALIHTVKPDDGEVLVTGGSGGVGSVAISILTKIGYEVVAVGGMTDEGGYLKGIGAKEVIQREDAADTSGKPVLKARWAGVIDTVGGDILATAIKSTNYGGAVTCCGNAASPDLPINVFPFILRGVRLLGIDSQNCPMDKRTLIWEKLADEWKLDKLTDISKEISLNELDENIELMLQGKNKGRTIVDLSR